MKKLLKIFLVFLFLPVQGYPQEFPGKLDLNIYSGYATYDMEWLKILNQENTQALPFDAKTINNFDPGYYFGGSLKTRIFPKTIIGLFVQSYSTGSRQGLKDYSGIYTFDQIMNGYVTGIEPEQILIKNKLLYVSASAQIGVMFSDIVIKESLTIGTEEESDFYNLSAFSITICPAVKLTFPVMSWIGCSLTAGRMFDTGGEVHLSGNKEGVLTVKNAIVETGWTGWRISLGLNLNLF